MGKRTAALAALGVCFAFATLLTAGRADAHTIGLSTGEYTARGATVVGKLAFARGEVASVVRAIDADHDGHLTAAEVEASRGAIKDKILGRITVTAGGAACTPALTDAGLTELDGILLGATWTCKAAGLPFEVELPLLDDVARGHRHVARAVSGPLTHDEVLYGDQRKFTIAADPAAAPPVEKAAEGETKASGGSEHGAGFWSFFKMGIEHILTGYDHLVFILGLVLARARLRSLLTIVTAFTLAHSITLALAVLNVWAPSSRIVEPAIALSIAYVGIENFFVKDASKRWRITFPFGLVHGFGFAGALQEIALPRATIPTALVSFNLGVEAGQLAVLALVLPVVLFLRDKTWFEPRGMRVLSGGIALAGGIWFVARVVS